jgi:hypothetical protein
VASERAARVRCRQFPDGLGQAENAMSSRTRERCRWSPASDRRENEVIKIKFSSPRLQRVPDEGSLHHSATSNHHSASQRAPSSIPAHESSSKRGRFLGTLPCQSWDRGNDFEGASGRSACAGVAIAE